MAIAYPDWLPLAQKSKTPKPDTGFRTDLPQVGAPIFQKLTDDLKTGFSLTWIFTRDQHRAFLQWESSPNYLDKSNQWFLMPIGIGSGAYGEPEMQELHFTARPTWSQSGSVFTWSGDVICRQLKNSDDDYADIIVELPPPWDSWLDIVVTGYPDNRDPESLPKSPMAWFNYRDKNLGYGLQFARSSVATYIDGGMLKSAPVNIPRYESNGLLIEGQATNIFYYSGTPNQWTNANVTKVVNQDGSITITSTAPTYPRVTMYGTGVSSMPMAANEALAITTWVKPAASGFAHFNAESYPALGTFRGSLNLSTLEITIYTKTGQIGVATAIATMEAGLIKLVVSFSITVAWNFSGFIVGPMVAGGRPWDAGTGQSLTVVRGQIEKQSFATSYIPTTTASSTRQPDQLTPIESGAKNLYREYIPQGTSSSIRELIPYSGELVPLNSHLRILKVWDRELTDAEKAALDL